MKGAGIIHDVFYREGLHAPRGQRHGVCSERFHAQQSLLLSVASSVKRGADLATRLSGVRSDVVLTGGTMCQCLREAHEAHDEEVDCMTPGCPRDHATNAHAVCVRGGKRNARHLFSASLAPARTCTDEGVRRVDSFCSTHDLVPGCCSIQCESEGSHSCLKKGQGQLGGDLSVHRQERRRDLMWLLWPSEANRATKITAAHGCGRG